MLHEIPLPRSSFCRFSEYPNRLYLKLVSAPPIYDGPESSYSHYVLAQQVAEKGKFVVKFAVKDKAAY
jgi:hypothetical protein